MENFLLTARQVGILFVMMTVGAVLRRRRVVSDEAVRGFSTVLISIVTPALIIDVFQRPFDPAMLCSLGLAFFLAVVVHAATIVVSSLVVRTPEARTRSVLQIATVFSNAGFMGLPLEQAILGERGVFFGVVYVVVFNLLFWSWGVGLLSRSSGMTPAATTLWARVRPMVFNPGTAGIGLGLSLFLCSVELPSVIRMPIAQMAALNTPLAMLATGYFLAGAKLGRVVRLPAAHVTALMRLAVVPLVLIAVLSLFGDELDRTMKLAMVIASAAPSGALVTMVASVYGCDTDAAAGIVSGTTLLSALTLPAVIAVALGVL